MNELDITHLVNEAECVMLSASQAELGPAAGRITWRNSMAEAKDHPLLRPDQIDAARSWIGDFGAWTEDEIAGWPDDEVQGFMVQYAAGSIREMEGCGTYEAYQADAESGRVSGDIWRDDDGRFYFSMCR